MGSSEVSVSTHLCSEVHVWPQDYLSDPDVCIEFVSNLCAKQRFDLIIPCTDRETVTLQRHASELPPIACSDASVSEVFFDKYLTAQSFSRLGIPFARSVLPSEYTNSFPEVVVKPRTGGLSHGIHFNPSSVSKYGDDFIVQPFLTGKEITTAFYVNRSGLLHSHITLSRQLSHGTTVACETTDEGAPQVRSILDKMMKAFAIRGSCNIQSKITESGDVIPFEVNGRVSGTASIRAQFGFEDVKYLIQEYVYGVQPTPTVVRSGRAFRMLIDVIEFSDMQDQPYYFI